jgi:uncharacterized membrane protein
MDMNGWWMLWAALMMLIFWGGLAALVVWAVGTFTRRDGPVDQAIRAVEVAEHRYASGEISREEYLRIMSDLGARLPGADAG